MGGFEYPLTLLFNSESEHIKHVKGHLSFYARILDKENQLAKEKSEKDASELRETLAKEKAEKEKIEKLKLAVEENLAKEKAEKTEEIKKIKFAADEQLAEVKAEKTAVEEKLVVEIIQRKKAEKLDLKRQSNAKVEPTAKGKTFEEEIAYVLKKRINTLGLNGCYWVVNDNKQKACDIRINWADGVVGIEAKHKGTVTQKDMEKFNRDRLKNEFNGAVFWSKTEKIPMTSDIGDDELFIEMMNNCLYVRGEDFELITQFIFTYINFLHALKSNPSDNTAFVQMIRNMIDMMRHHYSLLVSLKKNVYELDKALKNDLRKITEMCQKHQDTQDVPPFQISTNDLYLGPKKDFRNLASYESEPKSKQQNMNHFFASTMKRPAVTDQSVNSVSPSKKQAVSADPVLIDDSTDDEGDS